MRLWNELSYSSMIWHMSSFSSERSLSVLVGIYCKKYNSSQFQLGITNVDSSVHSKMDQRNHLLIFIIYRQMMYDSVLNGLDVEVVTLQPTSIQVEPWHRDWCPPSIVAHPDSQVNNWRLMASSGLRWPDERINRTCISLYNKLYTSNRLHLFDVYLQAGDTCWHLPSWSIVSRYTFHPSWRRSSD